MPVNNIKILVEDAGLIISPLFIKNVIRYKDVNLFRYFYPSCADISSMIKVKCVYDAKEILQEVLTNPLTTP